MTESKLEEANDIHQDIEIYKHAVSIIQKTKSDTLITIKDLETDAACQFCLDAIIWAVMKESLLSILNEAVSTLQKRLDSL
jgi:hypothetical protein